MSMKACESIGMLYSVEIIVGHLWVKAKSLGFCEVHGLSGSMVWGSLNVLYIHCRTVLGVLGKLLLRWACKIELIL